VFGRHGDTIIRLMIMSILGATNAMLLSSSRLVYSSAATACSAGCRPGEPGRYADHRAVASGLVAVVFLLSGTFLEVLATVIYFPW
jgi:hypothetical protein